MPLPNACNHDYGPIEVDIIGFMLESYPEAAAATPNENSPLCTLFNPDDPCNYTMIAILLEAAPDAASTRDDVGKLPRVVNCLRHTTNGWHLPAGARVDIEVHVNTSHMVK